MSTFRTRCAILGSVLACLAAVLLAAFVSVNRIEHLPASAATVWSADADDDDSWVEQQQEQADEQQQQDQFNQMEEQLAQQTAQQAEDTAQQEQQIVDEQNAFNESMTAGNN